MSSLSSADNVKKLGWKEGCTLIINSAGALRKEYFISYLKLIMNARQCSVDEAKNVTMKRLFQNNSQSLGMFSYRQFLLAYEELKETI